MSVYHTIRLHGPWQADFFSPSSVSSGDRDQPGHQRKIKLPLDASDDPMSNFVGLVVLSRHFNWPHGIPQETVFLQVDSSVDWDAAVNHQSTKTFLSDSPDSISEFLATRNLIQLSANLAADQNDVLIREVSLKISNS